MNVLEHISWKQLGDRVVAVDTSNGDYYTFNEVASTIWIAVSENKSVDEIVTQILDEYDIADAEKVRQDIDSQLSKWKEMKLMS
jgi:hypothetical protein